MSTVEAPTISAAEADALRDLDRPDEPFDPDGSAARDMRSTVPASAARSAGLYAKVERLYDKIEAFVSRLSVRDNFWNSICSLIWLPLAFFSGIRLKALSTATRAFVAVSDEDWYCLSL